MNPLAQEQAQEQAQLEQQEERRQYQQQSHYPSYHDDDAFGDGAEHPEAESQVVEQEAGG